MNWHGRLGNARSGKGSQARNVVVCLGLVERGLAGMAWTGREWSGRHGAEGVAGTRKDWRGRHGPVRSERPSREGVAGMAS